MIAFYCRFSLVCTYIELLIDHARLILSFGRAHPDAEYTSDLFLNMNVRASYHSGFITTFPSSSKSTTPGCGGSGREMLRALATESQASQTPKGGIVA